MLRFIYQICLVMSVPPQFPDVYGSVWLCPELSRTKCFADENDCKNSRRRRHKLKQAETEILTYWRKNMAQRRSRWLGKPCGCIYCINGHAQQPKKTAKIASKNIRKCQWRPGRQNLPVGYKIVMAKHPKRCQRHLSMWNDVYIPQNVPVEALEPSSSSVLVATRVPAHRRRCRQWTEGKKNRKCDCDPKNQFIFWNWPD